jgi:hypothetical protein
VPRAPLAILMVSSSLAFLAFMVFQGTNGIAGGAQHWARIPLLAFGILFAMGCLVLVTTLAGGPRGSVARFK